MIFGESVAKQHRLVVIKLIMWTKWRKEVKPGKRTKWWRLKEKVYYDRFRTEVLGTALSPFLFAIVMDKLTEEIRTESPWDMMFADDIVLCREDRRQLQEVLEVCRSTLEKRGLKVSRSKTEYMQAGGADDGGELRELRL